MICLIGTFMVVSIFLVHGDRDFTDGRYFTIVTLSTLGYGDIVPTTDLGKMVTSGISLICVPIFAMLLGQIVDIVYGKARNDQIHTVVGGLTTEKFEHLIEFCDEMVKAGAYNSKPRESRREEVTPFE